jgi:hypothetical protein
MKRSFHSFGAADSRNSAAAATLSRLAISPDSLPVRFAQAAAVMQAA